MPGRPKRPGVGDKPRRASIGYSAGAIPSKSNAASSPPPTKSPGPELPSYDAEAPENYGKSAPITQPSPQVETQNLLRPISSGGFGPGTFSVGNSANGTINLGGILGPRANPNFNPNNPQSGELPYQTPGFFRRMFGDTGAQLNSQFVSGYNQQSLADAKADADWRRYADLQRELEKTKTDTQWGIEKSRLDMDAARAQLQSQTQRDIDAANNARRLQEREQDRRAKFEEQYGTDPIRANALQKQEIENRVGLSGLQSLGGSAFGMRDPWTGEISTYAREGGTPGGWSFDASGNPVQVPAVPGQFRQLNLNGGNTPVQGPPAPVKGPTDAVSPDALELLRKAAGATKQLPPPQLTPPVGGTPLGPQVTPGSSLPPGVAQLDSGVRSVTNTMLPAIGGKLFDWLKKAYQYSPNLIGGMQ